jgi:hypothetical protein
MSTTIFRAENLQNPKQLGQQTDKAQEYGLLTIILLCCKLLHLCNDLVMKTDGAQAKTLCSEDVHKMKIPLTINM